MTKGYFEVPVLNITPNFLLIWMEKTKIRKGFYEKSSTFVFLNCSLVTEYRRDGPPLNIQSLYAFYRWSEILPTLQNKEVISVYISSYLSV